MKYLTIIIAISTLLTSCIKEEIRSDGYGNFEAEQITISALGNGTILQLNISEGEILKANSIVGAIDTTDLVLKKSTLVQNKKSVLSQINSVIVPEENIAFQQKENLEINLKRVEKMFKEGAATQQKLDDINGQYSLIEKQIEAITARKNTIFDQAEALQKQIDQVEEAIKKCTITNPINGTVLTQYAYAGEVAAFGKPLYQIADLEYITLKVYVSGAQLPHISIGEKAEVLIDKTKTENSKLEGVVSWIASQAEFTPKIIQTKEERVSLVYAVKIRVKNDGRLKIGMPGEANFKK